MILVYIIDIFVVGGLIALGVTKGVERSLPFFAFCVVLFPLETMIQLPGLFGLTVHRIGIITLGILVLILTRESSAPAGERRVPLGYLMLLQLFWNFVATANSPVFTISFKATLSQALDFFVLYYIFVKTVTRVETIHKILAAIFAAMVVCSALGYFEAYRQWTVMDYFPVLEHRFGVGNGLLIDEARGIRAHATFPHAILFGATLSMVIPLGIYLLTLAKSWLAKLALWAGIVLMFLSIYKTVSRGAWIAAGISLIGMFMFSQTETRKRLLMVGLLSISVLVIRPGVWDTIRNTYAATLDPETTEGESYQWRYALMRLAKEAVGKSLGRELWGYGPESFYYLGLETEFAGKTVKAESCDSSVAALIIETGYVGLFFTALVLIKATVIALRDFRALPKPFNQLSLVLFMNLMTFCFMMTNVAIYGWGQQNYMLWILVAVTMVYANLLRSESLVKQSECFTQAEESGWLILEQAGPWT